MTKNIKSKISITLLFFFLLAFPLSFAFAGEGNEQGGGFFSKIGYTFKSVFRGEKSENVVEVEFRNEDGETVKQNNEPKDSSWLCDKFSLFCGDAEEDTEFDNCNEAEDCLSDEQDISEKEDFSKEDEPWICDKLGFFCDDKEDAEDKNKAEDEQKEEIKKENDKGEYGGILDFFLGMFGLKGVVVDDLDLNGNVIEGGKEPIDMIDEGSENAGLGIVPEDAMDEIDAWDEEQDEEAKKKIEKIKKEDEIIEKVKKGDLSAFDDLDLDEDKDFFVNEEYVASCELPKKQDFLNIVPPGFGHKILDEKKALIYNTRAYCGVGSFGEFEKMAQSTAKFFACPAISIKDIKYKDIKSPCSFILDFGG